MEIGVIHDAPTPPWSARRLIEAARSQGYPARYYRISRIHGYVSAGPGEFRYGSRSFTAEALIVRSLGFITNTEQLTRRHAILKHLELSGRTVINPPDPLMVARDKYLSLVVLERSGIPVPPTLVTEDISAAVEAVEKWGEVVVKPVVGSLGRGSIRLSDPDLAYNVFKSLLSFGQPLYIQKYLEKEGNADIRVFVVGEEAVAAELRRAPPGSWKTNVAQGGKPEPYGPDPEVEELAVRASRTLGLEYSGVDLAPTREGYVVLEVNASPLWRGLQEATGVDPATHIVRRLVELARR